MLFLVLISGFPIMLPKSWDSPLRNPPFFLGSRSFAPGSWVFKFLSLSHLATMGGCTGAVSKIPQRFPCEKRGEMQLLNFPCGGMQKNLSSCISRRCYIYLYNGNASFFQPVMYFDDIFMCRGKRTGKLMVVSHHHPCIRWWSSRQTSGCSETKQGHSWQKWTGSWVETATFGL